MNDFSTLTLKIDMNKVEYELGVSYKEALSMANRLLNDAFDLINVLQDRVLHIELKLVENGIYDETIDET